MNSLKEMANVARAGAAGVKSQPDLPPGVAARVQLARPLVTHKGDVQSLDLRKPNYGEFIELGQVEHLVYSQADENVARQMESRIDYEKLMRWAVRLSGIDRAILATLEPLDGYALSKAVVEIVNVFVVGNLRAAPTSSSSSAA